MTRTTLGNTCIVTFPLFGSTEHNAKVDTGATVSSLHGTDVKVTKNKVSFLNPELSPNIIHLPLHKMMTVSSADGGHVDRPVVLLRISIKDGSTHEAEFNINDRSHMDLPILIGQNVLQDGEYVIDPSSVDSTLETVDNYSDDVIKALLVLRENKVDLSRAQAFLNSLPE